MLASPGSLVGFVVLLGSGNSPVDDAALSPETALRTDAASEATAWTVGTLATPSLTSAFLATPLHDLSTTAMASLPDFFLGSPRYMEDRKDDGRNNYLNLKAGQLYPSESDLDTGWMVGAAYGRYFTRLVSIEFEADYFVPDSDVSSVDLYAVPLMLNGRINLPIWILQMYGGLGIGGIYYNVDGGPFDSDGWLAAGSAFLGADVTLFDKLSAGLELKYYITDEIRNSDTSLNLLSLAITLGFRF